jgi:hypothetical protein
MKRKIAIKVIFVAMVIILTYCFNLSNIEYKEPEVKEPEDYGNNDVVDYGVPGGYKMEWIQIKIFTGDGQPSLPIHYKVNDSIHEELILSSFKIIITILETDFYHEYNFKYNQKASSPFLIPKEYISVQDWNEFSNFEFFKNYTFQIYLEINSTNPIISNYIFFGEDNIVEGYFIAIDDNDCIIDDRLEYGSNDFNIEHHPHRSVCNIFKISKSFVFHIRDGGIID